MKKNLIIALGIVAVVLVLATGCKKDETPAKTYLLTALADSAGVDQTTFEYDTDNKLIRFGLGSTDNYNFFYSGGKVVVRNYVSSGTVQNVDSFFYDGSNRITRVEGYNGTNTKLKTTTFAYNGDNTINTATVDFVSLLEPDMLYEYVYTGGNISMRSTSQKDLGTYKLKSKIEYLGLDDRINPFESIYKNYLLDEFNLFYFVWSGAHNPTSAKQTDYDITTGNATSVASATTTYVYNSDNFPTRSTSIQGSTTQIFTFEYSVK